jgi:hypothetical protein
MSNLRMSTKIDSKDKDAKDEDAKEVKSMELLIVSKHMVRFTITYNGPLVIVIHGNAR